MIRYWCRTGKFGLPKGETRKTLDYVRKRNEFQQNCKTTILNNSNTWGRKYLTLTVSKEWFGKILSGEKTEEYREIKPYWVVRLFQNNSNIVDVQYLASGLAGRTDLLKGYIDAQRIILKPYSHILFINGYGKNRPRVEKEIVSITIGKPKKGLCPDKWVDKEFFIIKFK